MSSLPADLPPGSDVVAFTLGVIALMQMVVWSREREPGMLWFALAYVLSAVLVVLYEPAGIAVPGAALLLTAYATRVCLAAGLAKYLGVPARWRRPFVAALTWPAVLVAVAMAAGIVPAGPIAALPLLWADFGFSVACLVAARREPGAGHGLLAIGSLIGPAAALLDPWRGAGPHLRHDFPAAAIGFGIVLLVVSLMRKSRDSRRAQAHALRMSNFYAALSQTNQAILRIREPRALFAEICRICVEAGHARIACVYTCDDTHAFRVATAGPTAEFLAAIPNPWDITSAQARASYTVQALREGARIVCHDYPNDARSAPWRDRAIHHGIHTLAWLPLRRGARVAGVLMLGAGEPGFFDPALVELLDEMTGDISFALDRIDREAEHAEASRQAEAGLERFSRLFQTAPVSSTIVALADRRVVDVNQALCERYGATREDLIGRTTAALPYVAESQDRELFYEEMRTHGRVRNRIVRMHDAQGKLHLDLMNAEPIEYLGQSCCLVMSLDITELRAAEEASRALAQAQAASQAKTQFLSRMSHELRTPLNAVLGFSGLLRQEAAGRLSAQELAQLDHVQQAGWHLLRLINDVLDLSRIEAGQFGVNARGLELAPLLDEALQMSQPLATDRDVAIHASYRQDPPAWTLADPTRLRQVVLNVLSNAIKYNRPGGSVGVEVARRADHAAIVVRDTGLGMSPGQLAHLFEPFNRLGRDKQGFEGTGIGLALTRQLMQLMNGDIEVSSEEGRGTCVTLTLPRTEGPSQDASATANRPPDVVAEDAASPQGTVLYIEDNAVNTLLVEQLLARWRDVRFVAAANGTAGIGMAIALRPDLVLLDLQLPDLDGLEVLARLRAHDALQGVPVIVLSASAMPDDIAQALGRGATDYWTKPLDFQGFLSGIARLLRHEPPLAREDASRGA
jgi:PAS domain S-box-containing protein